jgi:polyhydroxybutyrate depolymerase
VVPPRGLRPALLLAALLLALPAGADSLVHGGIERSYLLARPPGDGGPRPLFVVLHPGGSYAAQFRRIARFDAPASAAGAVVAYPQGVGGHWNDGRLGPDGAPVRERDDVGFLLALIAHLAREGVADPDEVHVVGHSNGGMLALRLACEAPDRLRSVAAVSASLPEGLPCPATAPPLATLLIRGSADPYLPLAGGSVKGEEERGRVRSADATREWFAGRNGCTSPETKRVEARDGAGAQALRVTRYTRCTGAPTLEVRVEGSGHGWPGFPYGPRMTAMIGPAAPAFSAANAIVRFFREREVP